MPFKPDSYTTVPSYVIVDGASRTIEFLTRVFGATEIRRFLDETGKIRHSEVWIGDTVVMIADGAEGWSPILAHVHVYVEDVDAAFKLAPDAGAITVQEPTKKDDSDTRGGVTRSCLELARSCSPTGSKRTTSPSWSPVP